MIDLKPGTFAGERVHKVRLTGAEIVACAQAIQALFVLMERQGAKVMPEAKLQMLESMLGKFRHVVGQPVLTVKDGGGDRA